MNKFVDMRELLNVLDEFEILLFNKTGYEVIRRVTEGV
jgi:hypothetical protein